jgi:hypothetical protein
MLTLGMSLPLLFSFQLQAPLVDVNAVGVPHLMDGGVRKRLRGAALARGR